MRLQNYKKIAVKPLSRSLKPAKSFFFEDFV